MGKPNTGDHRASRLRETVERVRASADRAMLASRFHGDRHWRDVASVAHSLWVRGSGSDPLVAFLFALLHDSQRVAHTGDPDHGRRAAALASDLVPAGMLDAAQMAGLELALRLHSDGFVADGPTVGTCWDADRLTLGRQVDQVVEASFLSTATGREPGAGYVGRAAAYGSMAPSWDDLIAGIGNPEVDFFTTVLDVTEPRTLWHGTSSGRRADVARHGLIEFAPGTGVYFAPDQQVAEDYARDQARRDARVTNRPQAPAVAFILNASNASLPTVTRVHPAALHNPSPHGYLETLALVPHVRASGWVEVGPPIVPTKSGRPHAKERMVTKKLAIATGRKQWVVINQPAAPLIRGTL